MVARPVLANAVVIAFQRTAHKRRLRPAAEFPATQYRETDLAFITRLLAEEGLSYRFEHNQGAEAGDAPQEAPLGCEANHARHQLIIFDRDAELPAGAQPVIRYHRNNATEASDTLQAWQETRQVQPNAVALAGWDYKTLIADDCSPNVLFGNAGRDVLIGGYGDDHLYGGEGNDDLYDETSVIEASFDPKDRFEVEVNGNDWLDGGSGDDVLYSKGGFDNLIGGDGNDKIVSGNAYGFSRIDGGAGNDEIFFTQGDQVSGGDGNDKIYYTSAVYSKNGPNPYTGDSVVVAGEGADILYFSGFCSLGANSAITVDLTETTSRVDVIGGVGFYSKPASPALMVEGFSVGVDEIDISSASIYGADYSVWAVGALSENLGLINYAQIMTSADEVYRQPVSSSLKSPDDYGKAFFVVQGASVAAPDAISVAQFLDAYGHNATYGKSAAHYFMLNVGDKDCALYYFADDNQGNNQVAADELTPVLLLSGVRTEEFSAADLAYTFV